MRSTNLDERKPKIESCSSSSLFQIKCGGTIFSSRLQSVVDRDPARTKNMIPTLRSHRLSPPPFWYPLYAWGPWDLVEPCGTLAPIFYWTCAFSLFMVSSSPAITEFQYYGHAQSFSNLPVHLSHYEALLRAPL
jgi:hypothetical protein